MHVLVVAEEGIVRKEAHTEADQVRLEREAAMLQRAAHPGVVRLIHQPSDLPTSLVFELAPGGDLASHAPGTLETVAGIGAAVATTLADLHHLGVVHGRIDPSHILLDGEGRPVLCGFGDAGVAAEDGARRRGADVRALATILLDHVGPDAPRRVRRILRQAAGRRPPTARRLAGQLVRAVPTATLPGAPPDGTVDVPARARPVRARWPRVAVAAGAAVALAAICVAATSNGPSRGVAASACPPADDGCVPVPIDGGVLTVAGSRYGIEQGGVVVVGRWTCHQARPALLAPGTGEVWGFPGWARPGAPLSGRLVGRFPGATMAQVVPGRGGCDRLRVWGPSRPAETVDVRA